MEIEKNLKSLMVSKSGSIKAFSKEIDLAYTTVRSILERGIMNAKVGNVIKICKGLGIKPEDISNLESGKINDLISTTLKLEDSKQRNVLLYAEHQLDIQEKSNSKVISLDTYRDNEYSDVVVNGYASAGTGETLIDEVNFTVQLKGYVPPHDLSLQVNGDSMIPIFENGEIIFIEKTHEINSGQIGVFIIDGEAYVKKVFIEEDRIRLVSLNAKYDDLYFYDNESVELIGKVIL